MTEDDRDNLPERINELRPARFNNWLSEREWMPIMMETASQPRKLLLKRDVNETNIDYLENASCEEIFTARQCEYQDSYRRIPALDELWARYGDPTNRKIYTMSRDVEGRWMDLQSAKQAPRLLSIPFARELPGLVVFSNGQRARDRKFAGLPAGGSRIRTVGPAESKTDTGLLTFDHEELVGRGFGPPNLAFATSKLPHAGVAVG